MVVDWFSVGYFFVIWALNLHLSTHYKRRFKSALRTHSMSFIKYFIGLLMVNDHHWFSKIFTYCSIFLGWGCGAEMFITKGTGYVFDAKALSVFWIYTENL